MAGKKNFTQANTNSVYDTIADATAAPEQRMTARDREYTDEEIREYREAGKTRGRKNVKAIRINMAFSPTVHEYITIMARVRGQSITEFTNDVFEHSMKENAGLYEQAKAFRKMF